MNRLALVAAALLVLSCGQRALGQAFTYQGELSQAGTPANGAYDLEFRLFSAAAGGVQVGATTVAGNTQVDSGRFTAVIDPGAGTITGQPLWIQISARATGSPTFIALDPRQPVTPAPYAARALAEWLVPVGTTALSVDPGRTRLFLNRTAGVTSSEYFGFTAPTLNDEYGGMYIKAESASGKPFYGYNVGGRSAWTYLDGATGHWRLYNFGERITVTNTGQVGINETNPASSLDVNGTVRATGVAYRAPQTRYLSIPAGGFTPTDNFASATVENIFSGTYFASSVVSGGFAAPVQLPDGAVITAVDISVFDNTTGALQGRLGVRPFGGFGHAQAYLTPNSSNSAGSQTLSMIPNITVNNNANSYVLLVECSDWNGSQTSILGARVTYTVTAAD